MLPCSLFCIKILLLRASAYWIFKSLYAIIWNYFKWMFLLLLCNIIMFIIKYFIWRLLIFFRWLSSLLSLYVLQCVSKLMQLLIWFKMLSIYENIIWVNLINAIIIIKYYVNSVNLITCLNLKMLLCFYHVNELNVAQILSRFCDILNSCSHAGSWY